MDIVGGAGMTAMAALQFGHMMITIDINRHYSEEAKRRLAQWRTSTGDEPIADDDRLPPDGSGRPSRH
jgi:DNA modification methylase